MIPAEYLRPQEPAPLDEQARAEDILFELELAFADAGPAVPDSIDMDEFEAEFVPADEFFVARAAVRARAAERRRQRMAGVASSEAPSDANSQDDIGWYLNRLGEVPLLTKEQEIALAQIVERGQTAQANIERREREQPGLAVPPSLHQEVADGKLAKDYFIRANLRLVVSIAKKYPKNGSLKLIDLIQEGNLGLEHAVDKFDWTRGFKFSTYATRWIQQAIGNALDSKASLIRLPRDRSVSLRGAQRVRDTHDVPLSDEQELLLRLSMPESLDRPIGADDSEMSLLDTISDSKSDTEDQALRPFYDVAMLSKLIDEVLGNADFAEILRMSFGIGYETPLKPKQIAERYKLMPGKVERIISVSKKKLEADPRAQEFADEFLA